MWGVAPLPLPPLLLAAHSIRKYMAAAVLLLNPCDMHQM